MCLDGVQRRLGRYTLVICDISLKVQYMLARYHAFLYALQSGADDDKFRSTALLLLATSPAQFVARYWEHAWGGDTYNTLLQAPKFLYDLDHSSPGRHHTCEVISRAWRFARHGGTTQCQSRRWHQLHVISRAWTHSQVTVVAISEKKNQKWFHMYSELLNGALIRCTTHTQKVLYRSHHSSQIQKK
jgi:hypothetical protein